MVAIRNIDVPAAMHMNGTANFAGQEKCTEAIVPKAANPNQIVVRMNSPTSHQIQHIIGALFPITMLE